MLVLRSHVSISQHVPRILFSISLHPHRLAGSLQAYTRFNSFHKNFSRTLSDFHHLGLHKTMSSIDLKDSEEPQSPVSRRSFLLAHAPASSHGTYLDGSNEGVESLEEYQDGGYHPVHLGDTFGPSGRYKVMHKLGHGGFGTVWLCRDAVGARYIALKVLASELKSDDLPDLTLADLDQSHPGAKYITSLLDQFSLEGPNGSHYCLVLPILGPCVSPNLWERLDKDAGSALRRFAFQSTQALNFLHQNQICHGGEFEPEFVK